MHFERTLRGGLWKLRQGLGAGAGLSPVALTTEGHWGGDALRGCLGSWDRRGGDAAPALDSGWGRWWGMVLLSLRDAVSSGTSVRGHLGLRAAVGSIFKADSFPGFLWSPSKVLRPAPKALLALVGITPQSRHPWTT